MSNKKNKKHIVQKWYVPKCDNQGQWWWGYQKVRIIRHPEWDKNLYSFFKQENIDEC